MMNIHTHSFFTSHGILIARILMGALFLISGISKLSGIDGTAGYIAAVGLPAPVLLAWLAAILETLGGIAIIVGYQFERSALALAVFTFFISFPFHGPGMWETDPMQQVHFMKNMAIVGGLLYMVGFGSGETWKLKKDGNM